ncbi:LpqB family beta-propeller domain-containing protein [Quadrisphaera sp. KR29]|uniref:LpqB family beta-propeller domain-containing protein n=1 Tax=Quadrisphaera sp. KR29 TaxID=3461391 RepID=UPI0040449C56
MADPVPGRRGASRRAVLLALTGALGAAAAGCARIPVAGPVRQGGAVRADPEPGYRVDPVGPVPGATPEEVVRGFLLAGVGVDDDFGAARAFLSSSRRSSWRPTARTVVHPVGTLSVVQQDVAEPVPPDQAGQAVASPAGGDLVVVAVGAPVLAEVDPAGRYRPVAAGQRSEFLVTLVREREEWRIDDAPDLLLLDEARFQQTFTERSVMFVARLGGDVLVPDPRWLLDRAATATTLVEQVLAGPPPELAAATSSGAPSGTALPPNSVSVAGGVATVDLPAGLQRQRSALLRQLQQQLSATLLSSALGISQVVTSLDGGELAAVAPLPLPVPTSDGRGPLVLSADRVCQLVGTQLVPLEGLPAVPGASAPATLGDAVVVLVEGRTALQRLDAAELDGASAQLPAAVPLGADLTPPSLDGAGWTWTTPAVCTGVVHAVAADGAVAEVSAPWLAGRRVVGLRAAADGARLLVTSTGQAGQPDAVRVDVAGVQRAGGGAPVALSAPQDPPTPWLATAAGAVWVGATSVAVLGTVAPGSAQALSVSQSGGDALDLGAPAVWLVDGGRATHLGGPPPAEVQAVTLAGGEGRQSLVVGGADGSIWPREGSRWLRLDLPPVADPVYPG